MMIRVSAMAVLAAVLLVAPTSAWAQVPAAQTTPPPPPASSNDIVVTGKRAREAQVQGFVDALSPAKIDGQIVRYAQPACPGVIGLTEAQNRMVEDRLRAVGSAAGVPLAKKGCKPNVLVIVTDDKMAMARKVRAALSDNRLKPMTMPKNPGDAVVLHLEGELDANRQLIGVKEDRGEGDYGYGQVEVFKSARIRPGTSPTFLASVLLIEPASISGLTTTHLADYAAMRLYARVDPARLPADAPKTILNVLSAPEGSEVPITMTQWDLGYLKGLYASTDRSYAGAQRKQIRDRLRKEVGAPPQQRR